MEFSESIHLKITDRLILFFKHFGKKIHASYGYKNGIFHIESLELKGWYAPISPASPLAQSWELACGVFLLYSIFVTPLLISFFTIEAGFCGPAPTGGSFLPCARLAQMQISYSCLQFFSNYGHGSRHILSCGSSTPIFYRSH